MRTHFGVFTRVLRGKHRVSLTTRVIISVMVLTFGMTLFSQEEVYAYEAVKGIITCNSGLVRSNASTASACVFCVSKDNEVSVLGEATGKDGKTWYQVAVGDSIGYIRSDLVKKTTTKAENLSVNAKQAIESASNQSEKSQSSNNSSNSNQSQTTSQSSSSNTTTVQMGKVKGTSVRLRADAGTNSEVTGVLTQGASVIISDSKESNGKTWYKVQCVYNNKLFSGYVCGDYVGDIAEQTVKTAGGTGSSEKTESSESKESTVSGEKTQAKNAVGTVTAYGVNVRTSPVDGDVVCKLTKGNTVAAIEQTTSSDEHTWYKVTFANNDKTETGYIRSDFVEGVEFAKEEEKKEEKDTNYEKVDPNSKEKTGNLEKVETDSNKNSSALSSGAVKGINVNVRKTSVSGDVICRLSTGHSVYVKGTETGSDGNEWYNITFVFNNSNEEGFIRSDFVTVEKVLKEEEKKEEKKEEKEEKEEKKEEDKESKIKTGSVKGYGVRVRETAVNGNVVAQLDAGHPLEITGETDGSDGYTWYGVEFSFLGNPKSGYVRSDFVNVITTVTTEVEVSDEDFEESIEDMPDSYKNSLRALHEKYPLWKFVPVDTGLDWNEAVVKECSVGKNLVSKNSVSSWKSSEPQAYNWSENTWYGFDGGSWASASKELIMYYMDPRNFLDDSGIFQFETLEYEDYQNEAGVESILESSFMSGSYTDTDGDTRSYASTFVEAGKEAGISPYHLASRCLQEQGVSGSSQSISGSVSGYEGIFNFFNIGAYAANGNSATINGLKYAAGEDEENGRPWNSRYKSIMGSAEHVSEKYVKRGQNTLYFQKFNVVNTENGIYSHQYMTNILAASSEAARMRRAYSELNTQLVFRVPYYHNMPDEACEKPTSDSNPNNYLADLSVDDHDISPEFSSVVDTYYLIVDNDVDSIEIDAEPVTDTSSVGGTGEIELEVGTNTIPIVCKAQNGNAKQYTLIVQRNE